jgi:H+-translocating NAD(P) transhydrogenase subunit beta
MIKTLIDIGFLLASVGLIIGLKWQSDPATARKGNLLAALAMGVGILLALVYPLDNAVDQVTNYIAIVVSLAIGGGIGMWASRRVEMTSMPQMVSLFNGLGGLSAVFVGFAELLGLDSTAENYLSSAGSTIFALVLGAIAFSGSLLAYFKLNGNLMTAKSPLRIII